MHNSYRNVEKFSKKTASFARFLKLISILQECYKILARSAMCVRILKDFKRLEKRPQRENISARILQVFFEIFARYRKT